MVKQGNNVSKREQYNRSKKEIHYTTAREALKNDTVTVRVTYCASPLLIEGKVKRCATCGRVLVD